MLQEPKDWQESKKMVFLVRAARGQLSPEESLLFDALLEARKAELANKNELKITKEERGEMDV